MPTTTSSHIVMRRRHRRHSGFGGGPIAALLMAAIVVALGAAPAAAHPAHQALIPNGARVVRNGVPWPRVGHLTPDWPGSRTATESATYSHGLTGSASASVTPSDGPTFTKSPSATWQGTQLPTPSLEATETPIATPAPPPPAPTPDPSATKIVGSDTLNSFGVAFAAAGYNWTYALCMADTDGDGFSNGYELGDPGCVWRPGDTPERAGDITHPGYADSRPLVTTPSFRLVGPNALEGVLQGRIYPREWGSVNFADDPPNLNGLGAVGKLKPWDAVGNPNMRLSTAWAREYCYQTFGSNETRRARAWLMKERPVEDQQYLPPNGYVSVSDVSGCIAIDMLQCAFSYSDVGSPQNTTKAETHGLYVDCAYGEQSQFDRTRLVGPDPRRGVMEVFTQTDGWTPLFIAADTTGAYSNVSMAHFGCHVLQGYNESVIGHEFNVNQNNQSNSPPFFFGAWTSVFDAPTTLSNASITFIPGKHSYLQTFECDQRQFASSPVGPVRRMMFFVIAHGNNSVDFGAGVAAELGISPSAVIFERWNDDPEHNLTHASMILDYSVAPESPNRLITRLENEQLPATLSNTDPIVKRLGILGSRFVFVADPEANPDLPEEWMINGPTAGSGALMARYAGTTDWGHVVWEDIDTARDLCAAAGFPTPSGRVPGLWELSTQEKKEPDSTTPYRSPGGFVSVDGGFSCAGAGYNRTKCKFMASPNSTHPRGIEPVNKAAWIECNWTGTPPTRMVGPLPCYGVLGVRRPEGTWPTAAAVETPTADVCAAAGCPCDTGGCGRTPPPSGSRSITADLRNCTPATPDLCVVRTYGSAEEAKGTDGHDYQCWHSSVDLTTDPALTVPVPGTVYETVGFVVLNSSATNEHVQEWLSDNLNVLYDDIRIEWNNTDEASELSHFRVRVWDEDFNDPAVVRGISNMSISSPYRVPISDKAVRLVTAAFRVAPNHPRTASLSGPEFAIEGPQPWEGFIKFRYASRGIWGRAAVAQHARTICTDLGLTRPDKMVQVWYQRNESPLTMFESLSGVTDGTGWRYNPNATAYDASNPDDVVTMSAPWCLNATSFTSDFFGHCSFRYNERSHPKSGNYGTWVNCQADPPPMRLLGAFYGDGETQIYLNGEWRRHFSVSPNPWTCARIYDVIASPGTTPSKYGNTGPVMYYASHATLKCDGRIEDHQGWWECKQQFGYYPRPYHATDNLRCREPPSTVPFSGASVTLLSASMLYKALDPEDLRNRIADDIDTDVINVKLSTYVHVARFNMTFATIHLNDTGINANTELTRIANNVTLFPWLATDVRQVPVPAVPSGLWDWGFEPDDFTRPSVGVVTARPTFHYEHGVPCAAKWTNELSLVYCKTIFGEAAVNAHHTLPSFKRRLLDDLSVRHMVVEDIVCAPGSADIRTCSYAYATVPSAQCDGTEAVLVDCMPPTRTASFTATASVSPTVTPPPTRSATFSRTLLPTPSLSLEESASQSITVTPPPTPTVSSSATDSLSVTVTPPPTRSHTDSATATFSASPSVSVTVTPPPTPSRTFTVSLSYTPTVTPPPTGSGSFTASPVPTGSITLPPTPSRTISLTPSVSFSPSGSGTSSLTATRSDSASASASVSATVTPPPTPSATLTVTASPSLSATDSRSSSSSVTLTGTGTASTSPSLTGTMSLSVSASNSLSLTGGTATLTLPPTPSTTLSVTATFTTSPSATRSASGATRSSSQSASRSAATVSSTGSATKSPHTPSFSLTGTRSIGTSSASYSGTSTASVGTPSVSRTPSASFSLTRSTTVSPPPTPTVTGTGSVETKERTKSNSHSGPTPSASASEPTDSATRTGGSPTRTLSTHSRTVQPPTATASRTHSAPFAMMAVTATTLASSGDDTADQQQQPLRPGAFATITANVALSHAAPATGPDGRDAHVLVSIGVDRPLTFCTSPASAEAAARGVLPGAQPLPVPARCSVVGPQAVVCRVPVTGPSTVWAVALSVAVDVPYATSEHGRGVANVSVRAAVAEGVWRTRFAGAGTQPPPSAAGTATVQLLTVEGTAAAVTAASPALNLLMFGSSLRIAGASLAAIPVALRLGPWLVVPAIAANGSVATLVLPGESSAANANVSVASMRAFADNFASTTAAASCPAASAAALADAASAHAELNDGSATSPLTYLRRFGFDWQSGRLAVRPAFAERASVPPSPDLSVSLSRPVESQRAWATMELTVFVPGCAPVPASASAVARRTAHDGFDVASVRLLGQRLATTAADGCVGSWVRFEFPKAAVVALAHGPPEYVSFNTTTNATSATTSSLPRQVQFAVTDPVNLTVTDDTRTFVCAAMVVDAVPATADAAIAITNTTAASGGPSAQLAPSERRRVFWRVSVRGPTASELTLLAIQDVSAAGMQRSFPPELSHLAAAFTGGESPSDTATTAFSCGFDVANVSSTCRRGASRRQSLSPLSHVAMSETFVLSMAVPSYLTGRVCATLHVLARDVPGVSLPACTYIQPSESAQQALALSIFDAEGRCAANDERSSTPLLLVTLTWVAWFVLVVVRIGLWARYRRAHQNSSVASSTTTTNAAASKQQPRSTQNRDDQIVTTNVSARDALPKLHQYAGAVAPCHVHCAPVHATTLLVHTLVIFTVAAGLVNGSGALLADEWRAAAALGVVAAAVAVMTQPVVGLPFRLYGLTDGRRMGAWVDAGRMAYAPQDLWSVGGTLSGNDGGRGTSAAGSSTGGGTSSFGGSFGGSLGVSTRRRRRSGAGKLLAVAGAMNGSFRSSGAAEPAALVGVGGETLAALDGVKFSTRDDPEANTVRDIFTDGPIFTWAMPKPRSPQPPQPQQQQHRRSRVSFAHHNDSVLHASPLRATAAEDSWTPESVASLGVEDIDTIVLNDVFATESSHVAAATSDFFQDGDHVRDEGAVDAMNEDFGDLGLQQLAAEDDDDGIPAPDGFVKRRKMSTSHQRTATAMITPEAAAAFTDAFADFDMVIDEDDGDATATADAVLASADLFMDDYAAPMAATNTAMLEFAPTSTTPEEAAPPLYNTNASMVSQSVATPFAGPAQPPPATTTTSSATVSELCGSGGLLDLCIEDIDVPIMATSSTPTSPQDRTDDAQRPRSTSVSVPTPPEATVLPPPPPPTTKPRRAEGDGGLVPALERDPRTCVVVQAAVFTRLGYAIALVSAAGLSGVLGRLTWEWCDGDLRAFWIVVAFAVAVDATAGQALVAGATAVWRWLRHEEEEDDDESDDDDAERDDDGRVSSTERSRPAAASTAVLQRPPRREHRILFENHPVDGQWRYVGTLEAPAFGDSSDDDDDGDADAAAGDTGRAQQQRQ